MPCTTHFGKTQGMMPFQFPPFSASRSVISISLTFRYQRSHRINVARCSTRQETNQTAKHQTGTDRDKQPTADRPTTTTYNHTRRQQATTDVKRRDVERLHVEGKPSGVKSVNASTADLTHLTIYRPDNLWNYRNATLPMRGSSRPNGAIGPLQLESRSALPPDGRAIARSATEPSPIARPRLVSETTR
jgi:hypothetical protein